MKPNLDSRVLNIVMLVSALVVGLGGDLIANGMLSDKAAKWAAIAVALLTRAQTILKPTPRVETPKEPT